VKPVTCDRYFELLSARLDRELTKEEAEEVELHCANCPKCRIMGAQLAELKEAFAGLEDVPAPEGFARGVMDRIRAEEAKPKVIPLFRRPRFRALAGLAACAVLVVGLYGAAQGLNPRISMGGASPSAQAGGEDAGLSTTNGVSQDASMRTESVTEARCAPEGAAAGGAAAPAPAPSSAVPEDGISGDMAAENFLIAPASVEPRVDEGAEDALELAFLQLGGQEAYPGARIREDEELYYVLSDEGEVQLRLVYEGLSEDGEQYRFRLEETAPGSVSVLDRVEVSAEEVLSAR